MEDRFAADIMKKINAKPKKQLQILVKVLFLFLSFLNKYFIFSISIY